MVDILIVEDEESFAESLSFSLTQSGHQVALAANGTTGLEQLRQKRFDLILLDLMLPGEDGFEVCRVIQKLENPIPIIMVTAKGSETDRVVGLELGADDYLVKPFSLRELEARIKAVLRRRKREGTSLPKSELEIDFERRSAKRLGKPIDLSPKEWDLLGSLARENGKIVSKETLLNQVWGADFDGDPRAVEIHVYLLRQKLEINPGNPKHVLTVKRMGYRFEP